MQISMIVAADEQNGIGKQNKLPWHLPKDLAFFKQTTLGKPVIMGKNTWLSLKRPLSGRTNIVLTSSLSSQEVPTSVIIAKDWKEMLKQVESQENNVDEIFIIGGGKVYHSYLHLTQTIYFTRVHTEVVDADTFFPKLTKEEWLLLREEKHLKDENHPFDFTIQLWKRKL